MYFYRSVDIEIAEGDRKAFVYAKFSRFVLIGEIFGISESDLIGTNIVSSEKLIPSNQKFKEQEILGFMVSRSFNIKSYEHLTLNQQQRIDKLYKNKLDSIIKSDYWKVLKKDM